MLDALERMRIGAVPDSDAITLPLDPDTRERATAGLEVVDPEGVPVAAYSPDQLTANGAEGTPEWLSEPSPRPYERLYLPPAQVRGATDEQTATVVIDRNLTTQQAKAIRDLAEGGHLLLLVLAGPTRSPYSRGVGRLRASMRLAGQLTDAEVVALPLDPREAQEDPTLLDTVVASYSRGRVTLLGQHDPESNRADGLVLFFTGLSGSGKSTVARAVREAILEQDGRPVSLLDGDVVRRHLSAGLTFSPEDRDTNIRRIGWVAAEIAYHGGTAICSPIAPYDATRQAVREMTTDRGGDFVLVHISTPVEECARRDRKRLYAKAMAGEIPNFTGVSAPYEEPLDADITIDTTDISIDAARDRVLDLLRSRGHLAATGVLEWVI